MKLTKTLKRFWNMQKQTGGFTLVELIVVIAILAILAGVAIPAYSGYITKANEAGDQQLLSAVNRAFTAACIQEGVDINSLSSASMPLVGEAGAMKVNLNSVNPTEVKDAFATYFAGNENTAFKVIQSLVFDSAKHVFVDPASVDSFTVSYNGNPITVPSSAVDAYNKSNWGDVASADVLGLVGSVTDFAGAVDNATFLAMLGDPAYLSAAAAAMGVSTDAYTSTIQGMLDDAEAKYRAEYPNATNEDVANYRNAVGGQLMANNAVLVAAQNAEANKGAIIDLLTKDDGAGAKAAIGAAMSSDPANGLAQASLAYGLYTSFMLDKNPDYDTTTNPDPLDVMNTLDDPDFQAYLKTDKATTDLDGFVSVLDAAGKNTGNGVGSDIVQNGFADNENLQDLMQQILGK